MAQYLKIFVVLSMLFFLVSCKPDTDLPSISGRVVDSTTGAAVPAALVGATSFHALEDYTSVYTDSDGYFTLKQFTGTRSWDNGDYFMVDVTIAKAGYSDYSGFFNAHRGSAASIGEPYDMGTIELVEN